MKKGAFITIEGIDGAGKGTQIARIRALLQEWQPDFVEFREPGGTPISEQVREILLTAENTEMDANCELLLFAAARAQLVAERIKPALATGTWVLCDRFYDSTIAYQAGGRGLDRNKVMDCIALAVDGLEPDLTIYLDLDPEVARQRRIGREQSCGREADRMEQETLEFSQRVRGEYLILAKTEKRIALVDASQPAEKVSEIIENILQDFWKTWQICNNSEQQFGEEPI